MQHKSGNHVRLLAGGFVLLSAALGALLPVTATAHVERPAFFPQGHGVTSHPNYRPLMPTPQTPRLVVCKKPGNEGVATGQDSASRIALISNQALRTVNQQLLGECSFEHIQAAVNAVTQRGTTIYILPGVYREQPSIRALEQQGGAANVADKTFCESVIARGPPLSYEEQFKCPHIQNTIAIFGDRDFTDDDCGTNVEGRCSHPETVRCNTANSTCPYYDLQLEGTGARNTDVLLEGTFKDMPGDAVDGHFTHINGIRADRADGFYLRNLTAQIYEFNAVYVNETDGYTFDKTLARWNDEYGFLSFASDHGLFTECEGYGNTDSDLYPGSGADLFEGCDHETCPITSNTLDPSITTVNLQQRQATEIRNSKGHHSSLGYSGTSGNGPWVHDNEFYKNTTGMATESIFPGHPGMPQDHALWENNKVYSNNVNYYGYVATDGPCNTLPPRDRQIVPDDIQAFDALPPEVQTAVLDRLVGCPVIPFPVGTGLIIAGGNYDVFRNNQVFDNWKRAVFLTHAPAVIREGVLDVLTPTTFLANFTANPVAFLSGIDPNKSFDTSHFNRFQDNHFAENNLTTPSRLQPNGVDFWWDNSGTGNCWSGNTSFAPGGVSSDTLIPGLPGNCANGAPPDLVTQIASENPIRLATLVSCVTYDRNDPSTKDNATALGCDFFVDPPVPAGRQGVTEVIASQPTKAKAAAGQTVKAGYFVLNNDTGDAHTVNSVTVATAGATTRLSGLKLSVTTAGAKGPVTTSVSLTEVGSSNVFTFATPVTLPRTTYNAFELEATVSGTALTSRTGTNGLLLASGAGTAMFGMVLLVGGGMRRRYLWLLFILSFCASVLAGCNGSGNGSGFGGGSGGGNSTTSFTLTSLSVSTGGGTPVTYSGLPLGMGQVTVQ